MKKNLTRFSTVLTAILVLCVAIIGAQTSPARTATAGSITEMAGENIVRFYEEEIAGERFISNMNPARKARMCASYKISENRLNAVLILQDLGARVGIPQSADDLAKMNDKALISTGKTVICAYIGTLTDEEKQDLKEKFKSAISEK